MPECAVPDAVIRATSGVGQLGDRRAVAVEHARRRPGNDQPPRAERRGEVRGKRVGVHVQQRAVRGDADAGDDRHVAERAADR